MQKMKNRTATNPTTMTRIEANASVDKRLIALSYGELDPGIVGRELASKIITVPVGDGEAVGTGDSILLEKSIRGKMCRNGFV